MKINKTPLSLDVNILNSILNDVNDLHNCSYIKFIENIPIHMGVSDNSYGDEGVQGEYDEYCKIFEIIERPNILIKLTYITDSYGGNSSLTSIQFGRKNEKQVVIYEN